MRHIPSHGRLADAARADRRLRIRNVQRRPLHVGGYIQNALAACCGGTAWKPARRSGVEHPLLADRMANAQRRSAETWPPRARGWITRATSA